MPSDGFDRPRQIDAFVAEVLGPHCRLGAAVPAVSGSRLGPIIKEPQAGQLGYSEAQMSEKTHAV
jgi:hypothetical protein